MLQAHSSRRPSAALLFNSTCCWPTGKLLQSVGLALQQNGTHCTHVGLGSEPCSYFQSPLLAHPKAKNCLKHRHQAHDQARDQHRFTTHIIDQFITQQSKEAVTIWIEKNERTPLGSLYYKGYNVWDIVKGSFAKDTCSAFLPTADTALMNGLWSKWFPPACLYIDAFSKILDDASPNVLILFSGYFFAERACSMVSHTRGIPTIAFEQSLFKNRYYFSTSGFVGRQIPISISASQKSTSFPKPLHEMDSPLELLEPTIKQPPMMDQAGVRKVLNLASGEVFVAIMAQVPFDTVIVYDNPLYPSGPHALSAAVTASMALGAVPIVKLHPHEAIWAKNDTFDFLRRRHPNLNILRDEVNARSLMSASNAVVTVNSQTGLEALLLKRPLVALGNAYYTGLGLTYDVKSEEDVKVALSAALNETAHPDQHLLYSLLEDLLEKRTLVVTRNHEGLIPDSEARLVEIVNQN